MNRPESPAVRVARRQFFRDCGVGVGKVAPAGLLSSSLSGRGASAAAEAPANPLAVRKPHLPAEAERVIHLFMAGAPSQSDLFDHKPKPAGRGEAGDHLRGDRRTRFPRRREAGARA
jgi:hypothetical protein